MAQGPDLSELQGVLDSSPAEEPATVGQASEVSLQSGEVDCIPTVDIQ